MRKLVLVVCPVILLWAASCSPKAPAASEPVGPFDLGKARQQIEAANLEFAAALERADLAAVASFFTEDAESLGPNEPVRIGRDNIRAVYDGFIKAGTNHLSLTTLGVWGDEKMLAEEGRYVFRKGTGEEADRGKYLVLWKREGGRWHMFRDCSNSDLPAVVAKQ